MTCQSRKKRNSPSPHIIQLLFRNTTAWYVLRYYLMIVAYKHLPTDIRLAGAFLFAIGNIEGVRSLMAHASQPASHRTRQLHC